MGEARPKRRFRLLVLGAPDPSMLRLLDDLGGLAPDVTLAGDESLLDAGSYPYIRLGNVSRPRPPSKAAAVMELTRTSVKGLVRSPTDAWWVARRVRTLPGMKNRNRAWWVTWRIGIGVPRDLIYVAPGGLSQFRSLLELGFVKPGTPVVVRTKPPFRPPLLAGASAVHVESASEGAMFQAQGLPADRLRIFPVPVGAQANSLERHSTRIGDGEAFRLVSVGDIDWRRSFEFVLLAISRLREEGRAIRYEILGDGPERERILYTSDDLDLTKTVYARGRALPSVVRDRLRRAHVFLAPEVVPVEDVSAAALEAMAVGIPVVATRGGGLDAVVRHGVEGLVVPPWNVEALVGALRQLDTDPELRARMSVAARRRPATAFKEFLEEIVSVGFQPYEVEPSMENADG